MRRMGLCMGLHHSIGVYIFVVVGIGFVQCLILKNSWLDT